MSYGTLWCSLYLALHLYPYKVQITQQLKPADHQHRRYVEWLLEQQPADNDEAHFSLGVYVLMQKNCHIWVLRIPKPLGC